MRKNSMPQQLRSFDDILEHARRTPLPRMAVAAAEEPAVIAAAAHAMREGLVLPILVGNVEDIRRIADSEGIDITAMELVDAPDFVIASAHAVKLVHDGEAELVMKGLVKTKDFLRAVLDQEFGIRGGRPLSHVSVFESPDRSRLMFMTDCGINIRPRFNRKIAIIKNALDLAWAMGIEEPKVAVIAAVETLQL
ncbi:MAG TPA: phosphate butyryltransferase, partial [Candidatus Hydrogenedentes bacterium]|nr:phosphate butyryltransferase [Candidatus Hydrogenedentota bacterium]